VHRHHDLLFVATGSRRRCCTAASPLHGRSRAAESDGFVKPVESAQCEEPEVWRARISNESPGEQESFSRASTLTATHSPEDGFTPPSQYLTRGANSGEQLRDRPHGSRNEAFSFILRLFTGHSPAVRTVGRAVGRAVGRVGAAQVVVGHACWAGPTREHNSGWVSTTRRGRTRLGGRGHRRDSAGAGALRRARARLGASRTTGRLRARRTYPARIRTPVQGQPNREARSGHRPNAMRGPRLSATPGSPPAPDALIAGVSAT
jgi:hypothetical protein